MTDVNTPQSLPGMPEVNPSNQPDIPESKSVDYDLNSNEASTNGSLSDAQLKIDTASTSTSESYLQGTNSSTTVYKAAGEAKLSPKSKVGKAVTRYGNTAAKVNLVAPLPPEETPKNSGKGIGKLKHNFGVTLEETDGIRPTSKGVNRSSIFHCDSTENGDTCDDDKSCVEEMFCLDCHEVQSKDADHTCHNLVKVKSAVENQYEQCETLLKSCHECKTQVGAKKDEIHNLKSDLVKTRKAIAVELDEMFREIENRLHERKMILFTQLTDCSYHKECYLDDQIERMNTIEDKCSQLINSINKVNKNLQSADLLAYHCHQLKESSDDLKTQADSLSDYRLTENTCLKFDRHGMAEVRKSLNMLANVSSSNIIPSRCTASGDGLKKASVLKQTIVKVTPRDVSGQIQREKGLLMEAQLYNEEINVECQCSENSNGTYNILYIAPEKGLYKLAIKIFHQHVKGSPFSLNSVPGARVTFSKSANTYELTQVHSHHDIRSSSPSVRMSAAGSTRFSASPARTASPRSVSSAESFSSLKILPSSPGSHGILCQPTIEPPYGDYLALIGHYGRRKGELSNPQGVAMDYNGRIYCTDSSNQNIQMFTDTGAYIGNLGKRGRMVGQLLRPIGICITKDGCVVFTDYETKCVNVFKDGAFIRRIGQGKLIGPKGVTTTPRGSLIVSDNKGNQVLEFSINGRLLRKIESHKVDKAAQFAGPHYAAVNQNGDIYVSDFHNHSIKVFSREGQYVRSFGHHGSGNGQFNAPTGIAVDSRGYVLVSDWGNSRIQIFDEDGCFLSLVDTSPAPLFGPQALFATRDNSVIVADSGNHCVKIFKYEVL